MERDLVDPGLYFFLTSGRNMEFRESLISLVGYNSTNKTGRNEKGIFGGISETET